MEVDVASDLHLEFFSDQGSEFVASWVAGAPVLVLAGDVGNSHWWLEETRHLQTLCEKYEHVLYVAGNHDYYGTELENGDARFREIESRIENFRFLEQEVMEIDGVKFAGTTLWFREDHKGRMYENWMNDFRLIINLKPWVYYRNQASQNFLRELRGTDVVITHHMPSRFSVAEEFEDHVLNRYFLCEIDDVICDLRPKLWVHGHTHVPFDYQIGETRVVCHPMGYPDEYNRPRPYGPVTVEV
jgi:Icc-related predicted phosphoesterase